MDPTNVHNADGAAFGILVGWIVIGGGMLLLFAFGVLAVSALLGLTGFSVARLFGRRSEKPADDGGLDDLF